MQRQTSSLFPSNNNKHEWDGKANRSETHQWPHWATMTTPHYNPYNSAKPHSDIILLFIVFFWLVCLFVYILQYYWTQSKICKKYFFYKDYSFSFLYINKTRVEMLFSQQGSAVSTRATFKTGQNPDDEGFYWQNSKLTRFPTFKCQQIIIIC